MFERLRWLAISLIVSAQITFMVLYPCIESVDSNLRQADNYTIDHEVSGLYSTDEFYFEGGSLFFVDTKTNKLVVLSGDYIIIEN